MSEHARPRTVVVTGVAGGIGSAVAEVLAVDGFLVVGVDRRAGEAVTVAGDITDERVRADALAAARAAGQLYGLVSCAGLIQLSDPLQIQEQDWDRIFSVNVKAAYLFARDFVGALAGQRPAAIVNIASVSAFRPTPRNLAYASSKAAMVSMTRSLAECLAADGIRVNSVCPGLIDTELTTRTDAELAHALGTPVDEVRHTRESAIPMKRAGTAEEAAAAVSFVMSERAAYVTGACIHVNGGALMT